MHLAEPEELGIDPSDRQTAAAVPVCRKTPSFITVTSVFYQIYYLIRIIFKKKQKTLGMSLGGISKQLRDHQFEQEQPRYH